MGLNDINKLLHTSWNCKYHIVFAPKYRRMVFYKNKKNYYFLLLTNVNIYDISILSIKYLLIL